MGGPVSVEYQTLAGTPVTALQALEIQLWAGSGVYTYSDRGCLFDESQPLVLSAGASSMELYFVANDLGDEWIRAVAADARAGELSIRVPRFARSSRTDERHLLPEGAGCSGRKAVRARSDLDQYVDVEFRGDAVPRPWTGFRPRLRAASRW